MTAGQMGCRSRGLPPSHAAGADYLLTWNARHFVSKLIIPALTPEEWLNQQPGATP